MSTIYKPHDYLQIILYIDNRFKTQKKKQKLAQDFPDVKINTVQLRDKHRRHTQKAPMFFVSTHFKKRILKHIS